MLSFKCLKLKNEFGAPYFLLLNYDKHDKMQLFAKFKKFCGVGSEPPSNFENLRY